MTKAWAQMIRKFSIKEMTVDRDEKFMKLFGLQKNGRLAPASLRKEKMTR